MGRAGPGGGPRCFVTEESGSKALGDPGLPECIRVCVCRVLVLPLGERPVAFHVLSRSSQSIRNVSSQTLLPNFHFLKKLSGNLIDKITKIMFFLS